WDPAKRRQLKEHPSDALPPRALARIGTLGFRHQGIVTALAFAPGDGRFLVSGSQFGELRLWEAATGKLLRAFTSGFAGPVKALAISSSGTRLASDNGKPGVWDWDVSLGHRLCDLDIAFQGQISSMAFSSHSDLAICADNDSRILIYDPSLGKVMRT